MGPQKMISEDIQGTQLRTGIKDGKGVCVSDKSLIDRSVRLC